MINTLLKVVSKEMRRRGAAEIKTMWKSDYRRAEGRGGMTGRIILSRVGKNPGFSEKKPNPPGFFRVFSLFFQNFMGFFLEIFYLNFYLYIYFININSDKNKFLTHDSYFNVH